MGPVLYVTIDGVLDHLGFSQVLRVVEALAGKGVPYALVSLERARDLGDAARVASVRARLLASGIDWTWAEYREGAGGRGALENLASLGRIAARVARRRSVRLVHARGYHGALIARALRVASRVPYVFDARGLWIDERLEERRWFTTPTRLAVARRVEDQLYRDATAVVTLTQLHADDVMAAHRRIGARPVVVIPTCADYAAFGAPGLGAGRLPRVAHDLEGRLVLGVVGSLNRAYLGEVAARLAERVLTSSAEARLLVLSAQSEPWRHCLEAARVPMGQVVLARADHEAMPDWLSLVSAGLLLLTSDTRAKRAMMPTKLAEFFAAGVSPIVHGCNPEVRAWVERAGSGQVLDRLDDTALDRAAVAIAAPRDPRVIANARALTAEHFSLSSGVDRYASLLRDLEG